MIIIFYNESIIHIHLNEKQNTVTYVSSSKFNKDTCTVNNVWKIFKWHTWLWVSRLCRSPMDTDPRTGASDSTESQNMASDWYTVALKIIPVLSYLYFGKQIVYETRAHSLNWSDLFLIYVYYILLGKVKYFVSVSFIINTIVINIYVFLGKIHTYQNGSIT